MNNEIKEIVDDLIKNRDKLVRGFYFPEDLLGTLDLIKLIDYITNLQNENRFLRSHLKLVETVFKFELEDLQKENERLRTALNGSDEKRKRIIEYIKSNYIDNPIEFKKDLLKILGGDEE